MKKVYKNSGFALVVALSFLGNVNASQADITESEVDKETRRRIEQRLEAIFGLDTLSQVERASLEAKRASLEAKKASLEAEKAFREIKIASLEAEKASLEVMLQELEKVWKY